jgi:hypothetical protein
MRTEVHSHRVNPEKVAKKTKFRGYLLHLGGLSCAPYPNIINLPSGLASSHRISRAIQRRGSRTRATHLRQHPQPKSRQHICEVIAIPPRRVYTSAKICGSLSIFNRRPSFSSRNRCNAQAFRSHKREQVKRSPAQTPDSIAARD